MKRTLVKNVVAAFRPFNQSQTFNQFLHTLEPIFYHGYEHKSPADRMAARSLESLLDTYPEYTVNIADMIASRNKTLPQCLNWLNNAIMREDDNHNLSDFLNNPTIAGAY